ncbi:SDR family oxidoreductase [Nitratireductor pacificus]|uniref:Short-chain dehydrogenase/reductase SDR n=1 Tax=Nitratireductor pacificus pht-3B TaxID=391937 RepID=K2M977_9HYPH|nr:SDR family oxidoreductase [Nitratireductor pacificus]EKF18641.1 short-chain dehydrogenase/reductase SDR [Nitratireductor pacificus pht-3B]
MDQPLKGKRVFVTAAGQGIGRASALAFARAGASVTATDIDETLLGGLAAEGGIATRRLDVLDDASVAGAAREAGRIDVLFNCAGMVHSGSILDMADGDLDRAFDLNVKGMVRTIRAFLPAMLEHGDGCIINMASVVSSLKGAANRFVYGTTKAAVIGLTKAVAADYVTRGIRCNAICPGTVESPSLQERMRAQGNYEAARQAFIARQPMGRLGTPEEIAALAVHLAGATYTTGQAYAIDGGWSI